MISSRLQTPLPSHSTRRISDFLSRGTRADRVIPWLLAGFAVLYYSLYANAGLNLGGEGGTDGVVAMRLISGQRPIVDTFLGYNVLWFFPVAWLFELTGPNYLELRWYFFAFCTTSGLLTYFVVHGQTRSAWYAAIPAVMVILVPGMQFRNYMPFLGILNALLLTRAFVLRRESWRTSLAWMLAAGAGLGLTFLFRIDLGIFCTLIFLGLAALYPFGERGRFLRRTGLAAAGVAGGLLLTTTAHLPVWHDAKARGYDRAFLEQYTGWLGMINAEFRRQMDTLGKMERSPERPGTPPAAPTSAPTATMPEHKPRADSWEDRGALSRTPLSGAIRAKKWTDKSFAISTYLPLLISAIAILAGTAGLFSALIRRDPEAKERFLYPLTVLGCALTLFPQFYFFRPDTPHLSEMMVPFLAALALFIWVAGRLALFGPKENRSSLPQHPIQDAGPASPAAEARRNSGPTLSSLPAEACGSASFYEKSSHQRSRTLRYCAAVFAALCATSGTIYFSHAFPKESSGSIAAKKKATHAFRALNGVNVNVRDRDAVWLPKLRDAILRDSSPGEYVLCLPYSPTINFMTDRPSPMHNLYVDNTVGEGKFLPFFMKLVAASPPAVIVIDQRKINGTEISRFRNWAPQVYGWLWKNYTFVGRYSLNEVFVRPGRHRGEMVPEFVEVSD